MMELKIKAIIDFLENELKGYKKVLKQNREIENNYFNVEDYLKDYKRLLELEIFQIEKQTGEKAYFQKKRIEKIQEYLKELQG